MADETWSEVWLSPDWLEGVLQSALQDGSASVERGSIRAADECGAKGSDTRRCLLHWMRHSTNPAARAGVLPLFIKCVPSHPARRRAVRALRFFPKELGVYERILPAMTAIMRQRFPPGELPPRLAPDFFSTDRRDVVVLKDLKNEGFRVADARRGLNLEHCSIALRSLAVFHAASIAVHNQKPDPFQDYMELFFSKENENLSELIVPTLDAVAKLVESWESYERFGEKIRTFRTTAVEKMIQAMKPEGARVLVLNHGDFWVNNILFRYDPYTGSVSEARMVDFQLSRMGSPALDLQFFLVSSPSEVVRTQCPERLLEIYHAALVSTLAALKCAKDIVSLDTLKKEMEDKEVVGLVTALCVLRKVLNDTENIAGTFNGSRYRKCLQKLLLQYEEKGLL